MLFLLASLVGLLGIALLFYGVSLWRRQSPNRNRVQARLGGTASQPQEGVSGPSILRELHFSRIPFVNRMMERMVIAGMLRLWLLQGRVKASPGAVVLACLMLWLVGFAGGELLAGRATLGVVIGTVLGAVPMAVISHKRRKRFNLFAHQLPDALNMMKNSLRAGHTLTKAMQIVSEEMPDPVALEFAETVEELNLGLPVKRALENLAGRMEDENLDIFVAGLLVQREVGGNLNELLTNLAATIRERFRVQQEVKSLTAEGRISGYVIGALPIALALIIAVMQPDYLDPLLKTPKGLGLLKAAVTLEIVGFFFIRRASRVNF